MVEKGVWLIALVAIDFMASLTQTMLSNSLLHTNFASATSLAG
jgi:hypothetical protein